MTTRKLKNTIALEIPAHVTSVAEKLKGAGFEAYLVGGCVRNRIMNRGVKDWDYTTNATPEEIQKIFTHTVYENAFGTVGIVFDEISDPTEKIIEVTSYRSESGYRDSRRPGKIVFGVSLEKDLARRDFTINALAYDPVTEEIIDLYGGIVDLHNGEVRTVGNPNDRFGEDALRLMRAARIATQLNATIEKETFDAIKKQSHLLANISAERVRDELIKILSSEKPKVGIMLLYESKLLEYVLPELISGVGVEQNQAHKYDVFEHNLRTLEHAGVKGLSLNLRLAALLHDVSKPETREWSKEKKDWTFYIHEVVGARVAKKALKRLCFSNDVIETVTLLVRWHMFFSDTEKITIAGVRRMVVRVGEKNIWDLIDLRMCDRIGTGRPKEQPYRLRKYISLVEEAMREPITPGTLKLDGTELMKEASISPGPTIGYILHILLKEVLEDPKKNDRDVLIVRAKEILKLPTEEIQKLGREGKIKKIEEEEDQIKNIRKKYGVG